MANWVKDFAEIKVNTVCVLGFSIRTNPIETIRYKSIVDRLGKNPCWLRVIRDCDIKCSNMQSFIIVSIDLQTREVRETGL